MKLKGLSRSLLPLSIASTLVLTSFTASAASACKGLDEAACQQETACKWISGYTTKNGNAISAYCRSAGNKQKQGQNMKQESGSQSGTNERADSGTVRMSGVLEERNG
jgi:hypothetical protein